MSEKARLARKGALAILVLFAAQPLACDAGKGDGTGDGGGGGAEAGGEVGSGSGATAASENERGQCKDACDHLKLFGCNDAAQHAACYDACAHAASAAIELFVACVDADVCDAECSTDLAGQVGGSGGETTGGGGGGESSTGGADAPTCVEGCNEFIEAGCVPAVDCIEICSSLSELEQAFVGYCVQQRTGCALPDECADALPGLGEGEGGGPAEEGGGGGVSEGGGEVGSG